MGKSVCVGGVRTTHFKDGHREKWKNGQTHRHGRTERVIGHVYREIGRLTATDVSPDRETYSSRGKPHRKQHHHTLHGETNKKGAVGAGRRSPGKPGSRARVWILGRAGWREDMLKGRGIWSRGHVQFRPAKAGIRSREDRGQTRHGHASQRPGDLGKL